MPKNRDLTKITSRLYRINKITQVKELLREGLNPQEVSINVTGKSEDDVFSIIKQYKPARRWAVYHGHYEPNIDVTGIYEQFKPDFEYLKELSNKLKREY